MKTITINHQVNKSAVAVATTMR